MRKFAIDWLDWRSHIIATTYVSRRDLTAAIVAAARQISGQTKIAEAARDAHGFHVRPLGLRAE